MGFISLHFVAQTEILTQIYLKVGSLALIQGYQCFYFPKIWVSYGCLWNDWVNRRCLDSQCLWNSICFFRCRSKNL